MSGPTLGGYYVVDIMDAYVSRYTMITVGLAECLFIGHVYGADKLQDVGCQRGGAVGKPFHSISFHSIPFHSFLFHSIPFHSFLFHSIPFRHMEPSYEAVI